MGLKKDYYFNWDNQMIKLLQCNYLGFFPNSQVVTLSCQLVFCLSSRDKCMCVREGCVRELNCGYIGMMKRDDANLN